MKKTLKILLIIFVIIPLFIGIIGSFFESEKKKTNDIEKISIIKYEKEAKINIEELIEERENFLSEILVKLTKEKEEAIDDDLNEYKELETYYINELNILNQRLQKNKNRKIPLEKYKIELIDKYYLSDKQREINLFSETGFSRKLIIEITRDFIVDTIISSIFMLVFIIFIGVFFNFLDWLDIYEEYKWIVLVVTIIFALVFNPSEWIFGKTGESKEENINIKIKEDIDNIRKKLNSTLKQNVNYYEN